MLSYCNVRVTLLGSHVKQTTCSRDLTKYGHVAKARQVLRVLPMKGGLRQLNTGAIKHLAKLVSIQER